MPDDNNDKSSNPDSKPVSQPELTALERDKNARRLANKHLWALATTLVLLAVAIMALKVLYLGVPLFPQQESLAWRLEAEVQVAAEGEPVEVSLAVPAKVPEYRIAGESASSPGFGFRIDDSGEHRRAVWTGRDAEGPQTFFYSVTVFDVKTSDQRWPDVEKPDVTPAVMSSDKKQIANDLLKQATARSSDNTSLAVELVQDLNNNRESLELSRLLGESPTPLDRTKLLIDVLSLQSVPARLARGILLDDGARRQPLKEMVEVYDDDGWSLVDPLTGRIGLPEQFVLWQRGGKSLIDVTGADAKRLRFSAIETMVPTQIMAMHRSEDVGAVPFLFSLYDLPVEEQNVFKVLMLMPLGALILCITRNLIGFPTSGTFMPLLIALAFQETRLVPGLILFALIITVGLMLRSYLTHLNLLLVPRISAVVVVVIILMGASVILSSQFGIERGLSITFFPFVVIAWTIERMSTVWEQEGPLDAIRQCAGSLVVATIAYLVWQIRPLQHVLFTYSEVNLILLALILLIGSYNGYRLSELARFEPVAAPS